MGSIAFQQISHHHQQYQDLVMSILAEPGSYPLQEVPNETPSNSPLR